MEVAVINKKRLKKAIKTVISVFAIIFGKEIGRK